MFLINHADTLSYGNFGIQIRSPIHVFTGFDRPKTESHTHKTTTTTKTHNRSILHSRRLTTTTTTTSPPLPAPTPILCPKAAAIAPEDPPQKAFAPSLSSSSPEVPSPTSVTSKVLHQKNLKVPTMMRNPFV